MSSVLDLPSTDAMPRLLKRVSALESRLDNLERNQRNLRITPFTASNTTSFNYTWAGGRLWIATGGLAISSAAGNTGYTGFVTQGATTNQFVQELATATAAAQRIATAFDAQGPINVTGISPGVINIGFSNSGSTTSVTVNGLVIEWPQP